MRKHVEKRKRKRKSQCKKKTKKVKRSPSNSNSATKTTDILTEQAKMMDENTNNSVNSEVDLSSEHRAEKKSDPSSSNKGKTITEVKEGRDMVLFKLLFF